MASDRLSRRYLAYIDCLNHQNWNNLGQFIHGDVHYNGLRVGLEGYRDMLIDDCRKIPDLHFHVDLLVSEPPHVASRLCFDCTPVDVLFGIPVKGERVQFTENVFYEYADGKIQRVWSIIDKAAIAKQINFLPS